MNRRRLLAAATGLAVAASPASASAFALASYSGTGRPVATVHVGAPARANVGFAWDDALIGAGVGVVLTSLGAAGGIGVSRSLKRSDRGVLLG